MRLRKAFEQAPDGDCDGSAPENVADTMMRACAEGENPLGLAVNIEARRVMKYVGIVVRGERRWPYNHALENGCSSDLGVASGNAWQAKIAIATETKAFFERVGNECRVADQLCQLLWVSVEQVEGAAGCTARCR